jgi:hypothetical protein
MLRSVVRVFVQMFEGDFRFFHAEKCELPRVFKEFETGNRQRLQKRFNSAPKSDEHRTTGLSRLQEVEVATRRNDRRTDSAVPARVHQKEDA